MIQCILPSQILHKNFDLLNISHCEPQLICKTNSNNNINIKYTTDYSNKPISPTSSSSSSSLITDLKKWLLTNQNAITESYEEIYTEKDNVVIPGKNNETQNDSEQLSLVYIKSISQNKLYRLVFRTTDCHIIPLYTKERNFVDKETDKKIQPNSKTLYVEKYTPNLSRFNTTSKEFVIRPNQEDKLSILSFMKKNGLPRKVEPINIKKPKPVSASNNNRNLSIIYVNYHNITFKLYPKVMNLDFSKPIGYSDNLLGNIANNLGIESNEQKKNKGSIITKCKGDILKFTFSMIDINYRQITDTISRSIQVHDRNIYLRRWSTVSDRLVQVPLPRTNYYYRDPMIEVKRKNSYMKYHNIEPRWMYETRNKRLNDNHKCQNEDPAQKAYEATSGSSIVYVGPGTLNKARDGLVTCKLPYKTDDEKYEKWVVSTQRERMANNNDQDEFERYESNTTNEVPDWDMVIYKK